MQIHANVCAFFCIGIFSLRHFHFLLYILFLLYLTQNSTYVTLTCSSSSSSSNNYNKCISNKQKETTKWIYYLIIEHLTKLKEKRLCNAKTKNSFDKLMTVCVRSKFRLCIFCVSFGVDFGRFQLGFHLNMLHFVRAIRYLYMDSTGRNQNFSFHFAQRRCELV